MVSHHLETYGLSNIIVEWDRNIACFVKPSRVLPLQTASEGWLDTVSYQHVYEEYFL